MVFKSKLLLTLDNIIVPRYYSLIRLNSNLRLTIYFNSTFKWQGMIHDLCHTFYLFQLINLIFIEYFHEY